MAKLIIGILITGLAAVCSLNAAEEVHYVNSRKIDLPCSILSGPSGIKSIEIWITSDNGATWTKKAVRTPKEGHLSCWVEQDGRYGFRTCVLGNNNLRETAPVKGDRPDLVFVVDTQEPDISIVSPEQGAVLEPGESAAVVWTISDPHLEKDSCMLSFSGDGGRTWKSRIPIKEKGRKVFTGGSAMPSAVFRVTAADRARNRADSVIAFSVKQKESRAVQPAEDDDQKTTPETDIVKVGIQKDDGEKDADEGSSRTITIITDGQLQEYHITPADGDGREFTSINSEAVQPLTEEATEIVIIEGKKKEPGDTEAEKHGPDVDTTETEVKESVKEPEARKPVQVTEALDGKAVQLCRRAVEYEVFDDFKMARKLYLMALKREPKYYRARKGLADLYFRNEYFKYALKHFKVLRTIDPENTDFMVCYAFCLYKIGNIMQAEKELKKVLHVDPDNVDSMWYLSKIYRESGKINDAVYLWIRIKNAGLRNNKWYDFADSYLNIYSSRIGHS